MISRVAEHCFWLSRYLERAENTARVLEVNHTLLLDFHVPVEQQWRPLLIISGVHDYKEEANAENVQDYMTWDASNPSSIASSLGMARENGRIIREVISAEVWERLNYYHLWMQSPAAGAIFGSNRSEFYAQIRRINQLLYGIACGTMSHGEPFEFYQLGMYLERVSQTARILDVKYHTLLPKVEEVGTPTDSAHWIAILMSCSGYEPFHKKARNQPADPGMAVAEFLIFDDLFPRSILRCLRECQEACSVISGDPASAPKTAADQRLAALVKWVESRSIADVVKEGLHQFLTRVVDGVIEVGNEIHKTYFDPPIGPPSGSSPGTGRAGAAPAKSQTQVQSA